MTISSFIAVFFIAATKFLFGPFTAILAYRYTFWECILTTTVGGIFGVTFFYFFGELIFLGIARWRHARDEKKRKKGIEVVRRKFSPMNRRIIRIKHRFGLWGLGFITPCIISIPIGSVIIARFYHHRAAWQILSVLYIWVIFWSFLLTYFNDTVSAWLK